MPLAPSSFPSQVFFGEAALHLHRATCTFNLFVSALRQEKKRRRVLKSAGKLSTRSFFKTICLTEALVIAVSRGVSSSFLKTICLTEALVIAVSRGVSSSFLKTICLTEALETAVSKGVRQECGEVTRGRLPNDCCLPRHQKHVFACFGTCFCCGPKNY